MTYKKSWSKSLMELLVICIEKMDYQIDTLHKAFKDWFSSNYFNNKKD
jgi:hypothetical protein